MSSSNSIVNILHTRFGKFIDTLAKDAAGDLLLNKLMPYDKQAEVGESYTEAVVLGAEVGFSIIGSTTEVSDINPAIAAAVKQAVVTPCITVLRSVIPWAMASRSEKSEGAFVQTMKHVVKNHVLSHKRFLEILKVVGRDARGLGTVSYATATYRGVSFTAGAATMTDTAFGSITFATGGVDTTNKYILLAPGNNASGFFTGMQGVRIRQIATATMATVGYGKLVGYDSANGILKVDFTPTAASAANSHAIVLDGMESSLEFYGLRAILNNTGSLFGINATTYNLWKANQKALGSVKLTFARLLDFLSDITNASGASGAFDVIINPRTFADLISDESALRQYDASYSPEKYNRGARAIEFIMGDITLRIRASRYCFEGDAYVLNNVEDSWVCSGSSDVAMSIPNLPAEKLVVQLQDQTGVAFHTFADTYMLCREPSKQGIITGINDESAS